MVRGRHPHSLTAHKRVILGQNYLRVQIVGHGNYKEHQYQNEEQCHTFTAQFGGAVIVVANTPHNERYYRQRQPQQI
jgi:hypothetical protein